ncbi:hypothetical protein ACHAQA_009263 [Verticillium albo-atrum]
MPREKLPPSPPSSPPTRATRPKPPRTQSAPLHLRTRTPALSTIVPAFLSQRTCTRCTVRIVHVSTPDMDRADQPKRAVVEWGLIPYFKTTGKPGHFSYHTMERLEDLRPELWTAWQALQAIEGDRAGKDRRMPLWVKERLRDSWVIEQLVYWVEFLQEWKYYRDYYIFREELFGGEVPEIQCPGCANCAGRLAALVPLPVSESESESLSVPVSVSVSAEAGVPVPGPVPVLNRSASMPETEKTVAQESFCEVDSESCD